MARYKHPMTVGLPFGEWPNNDQNAWLAAIDAGDDLFDGGLGSDWKPKTRRTVEKAYGNWLRFLRDQKTLSNRSAIEKRFTTSNLRAYIDQLRQRVSSITVVTQLRSLSQAVRAISPDADRELIKLAISRLQATASPSRDKSRRLVSPLVLLELGQKLMQEWRLRDAHDPRLNAMDYRDGLMIAFLSLCPIRLENLAAIQINTHLYLDITPPLLRFAPEEMKNGHPLEFHWPVDLQTELKFYLSEIRPILATSPNAETALWPSLQNGAMSPHGIYTRITQVTKKHLGRSINPHLFRDAAATWIAEMTPDRALMVAGVLQHRSFDTTRRHYIQGQQHKAVRQYQDAVQNIIEAEKGDWEQ